MALWSLKREDSVVGKKFEKYFLEIFFLKGLPFSLLKSKSVLQIV